MGGYRRNDGSRQDALGRSIVVTHKSAIDPSFIPHNPAEMQKVRELARVYTDHHWGAPPDKVIRVKDSLIPDVTAMGKLRELILEHHGGVKFGPGSWVAWNHRHPRHRLYLVLGSETKESLRNAMKHLKPTEAIQKIAERAGGAQVQYKLPNVKGYDLGPLLGEVYWVWKRGDDDDADPPGSSYIHEHGGDGMGGTLPHVAIDVAGRLWVCGGDYDVSEAGIVG